MSEENNIGEILNLVEEAQKRGKFNLVDAIKGRAYPEKQVIIYTDAVAAQKLFDLDKQMSNVASMQDLETYAKLEKEAEILAEEVKQSKLIFNMVGLPQDKVDAINDSVQQDEESGLSWSRHYVASLVAASIKSVENANGEIDERDFTPEDGKALYYALPHESWQALSRTVEQLTLATGIFKGITDAGFLQKS